MRIRMRRLSFGRASLAAISLILIPSILDAKITFIKAGQVFDGKKMLGPKAIILKDGLIQSLVDIDSAIPEGAEVLDAGTSTILPGLIDGHLHFMAAPLPYVAEIEKHSWGKLAVEGNSEFPQHRFQLLKNGITTIVDMGAPPAGYRKIRTALEKGKIVGPEIYFPGPLITAPGGHPAGTTYIGQHDLIDNGTFQVTEAAAARERVKALAEQGMDFIKIVYDRMWYRPGGAPRLKLEVAEAVIDEARKLKLRVFAHVGSEEEALAMIEAGVDGIEHGFASTSDAVFEEMKSHNVVFTPTICAYVHYSPAAVSPMRKTLRRAWELGVAMVVGTDFPASYGENCGDDIFKEMKMWEDAGIPRVEILKSATSAGAAKIGKDREIGIIAQGCRANLVFLDGATGEEELSADRISLVMLHGETVIENKTLFPAVSPRFREKSRLFFPYAFYDPVQLGVAAVSVTEWDLFRTGVSASADVQYSFRGLWSVNLMFSLPSPVPRTALRAGFHYDGFHRLFYGIGNYTKKEEKIEYAPTVLRGGIEGTTRLSKAWKVRTQVEMIRVDIQSPIGGSLPDVTGARGGRETVLSLGFVHDTRDHENNPWSGTYLSVTGLASLKALGSDHAFQKIILDARGYISPLHKHILAGRLCFQQLFGKGPFYYMPEYGSETLGRGYRPARFRANTGIFAQAEYRFPIWSFVSGTAFLDLGQVGNGLSQFAWKGFHSALGFGPRFSFGANENSILAIDFGFCSEDWNLVVRMGHVF